MESKQLDPKYPPCVTTMVSFYYPSALKCLQLKCLPNTLQAKSRVWTIPFVRTHDKEQVQKNTFCCEDFKIITYYLAQLFRIFLNFNAANYSSFLQNSFKIRLGYNFAYKDLELQKLIKEKIIDYHMARQPLDLYVNWIVLYSLLQNTVENPIPVDKVFQQCKTNLKVKKGCWHLGFNMLRIGS